MMMISPPDAAAQKKGAVKEVKVLCMSERVLMIK
jgi:hypothetical protein